MGKQLMERIKYVMKGEKGASNVEIVVWISVVLVLATVLFIFRDQIKGFFTKAGSEVDGLKVK